MTEGPGQSAGGPDHQAVEVAARDHAGRVVRGDPGAQADVDPGADLSPPDLVEHLLAASFTGAELVAHARIGAHHILKTRFVGPTTVIVQARWVRDAGGVWRVREAEIARVESATTLDRGL